MSPHEALARLLEGNERFVSDRSVHPHCSLEWRARLTRDQRAMATIVGCSDSRVPLELLFDLGFGDLFVVREAGNIVDVDVTASVQYGVIHVHTPVVLVLGHENCGAVTAALQDFNGEPLPVQSLLRKIQSALRDLPVGSAAARVQAGMLANVRQSVHRLRAAPGLRPYLQDGRLRITGAWYSLHTGRVELVDGPG